jgi:hypothetical protein
LEPAAWQFPQQELIAAGWRLSERLLLDQARSRRALKCITAFEAGQKGLSERDCGHGEHGQGAVARVGSPVSVWPVMVGALPRVNHAEEGASELAHGVTCQSAGCGRTERRLARVDPCGEGLR